MSQFPFGVMAKGFLHGFAALYGLFIVGFLFIFGLSFLLPEGILRNAVMVVAISGFLGFCIIGVVLRCKKPDIFSVREDYYLTIKTEGSKVPGGKVIKEISELIEPRDLPQINGKKGREGEAK